MALTTRSQFYYGVEITSANNLIDFREGAPNLVATLRIGAYSLTDLAVEVARALNAAGDMDYTVTLDRDTRALTIAASGAFDILAGTGISLGASALPTLGFDSGSNYTAAISHSYTGNAVGSVYRPQFILQNHVSSEDFRRAADATVNRSASGRVEIFSFGEEKFVEFNIRYATDIAQPAGGPIENDATAIEKLRLFLRHLTSKFPVEYMPDRDDPDTFETLILEKTPEDSKGVGYRLRELYGEGLPGYFETGVLTLRVIE